MENNNESILESTKSILGLFPEDDSFDNELILHINGVLANLIQMGIGPQNGYFIQSKDNLWSEFLSGDDLMKMHNVKTYVAMKVKLTFDPPASSTVKDSLESQCKEFEYRMYTQMGGY